MGSNLDRFFSRMGARVKVMEAAPSPLRMRWNRKGSTEQPPQVAIDIRRDKAGEFFEIRTAPGSRQEIDVLNLQPREKHLVLLSRQFDLQDELLAKQKFLCGRAKIAIKPEEVRTREQALGVSRMESFRRKNAAYARLGEWFFLSEPHVSADSLHILRNAPLSRGNGSKAHIGEVRHPDHETITLNGWRRVLMNTENRSSALRYLAFLD